MPIHLSVHLSLQNDDLRAITRRGPVSGPAAPRSPRGHCIGQPTHVARSLGLLHPDHHAGTVLASRRMWPGLWACCTQITTPALYWPAVACGPVSGPAAPRPPRRRCIGQPTHVARSLGLLHPDHHAGTVLASRRMWPGLWACCTQITTPALYWPAVACGPVSGPAAPRSPRRRCIGQPTHVARSLGLLHPDHHAGTVLASRRTWPGLWACCTQITTPALYWPADACVCKPQTICHTRLKQILISNDMKQRKRRSRQTTSEVNGAKK